jgi:SAM-dependent methyltransferase
MTAIVLRGVSVDDVTRELGDRFFRTYEHGRTGLKIIDIGAQDVNGSLREFAPADCDYVGVDFMAAKGVDVVLEDPYALPFPDGLADMVVCSSVLEHSAHFWLLFNEMVRLLKPSGLLFINAPANGSGLEDWGRRSGFDQLLMLESFTSHREKHGMCHFTAVFLKDAAHAADYPGRIQDSYQRYTNGLVAGSTEFTRMRRKPVGDRGYWGEQWKLLIGKPI